MFDASGATAGGAAGGAAVLASLVPFPGWGYPPIPSRRLPLQKLCWSHGAILLAVSSGHQLKFFCRLAQVRLNNRLHWRLFCINLWNVILCYAFLTARNTWKKGDKDSFTIGSIWSSGWHPRPQLFYWIPWMLWKAKSRWVEPSCYIHGMADVSPGLEGRPSQ